MTTEVEDKTEFKFSELSDKAKEAARDEYRDGDYPGYDWWDCTYEDAARMGKLMGIQISKTWHASVNPKRKGYETIDISFSGFSSQGSGASFEGDYSFAPDAIVAIKAETTDEELIRIATELTVLQLTRRLQGRASFSATIKTSGRYSHSMSMEVDVFADDDDGQSEDELGVQEIDSEVTQLMRDFADWIYKQLNDEYDYICSDEYVDEHLSESDDLYDEDGAIV